MRRILLSAAIAFGATMAASAARAVPASPRLESPVGDLVQVRGFCGLGWHRGYYGVCVPNGVRYYGPYAYAPPPVRCWWVNTAYGPRWVCPW